MAMRLSDELDVGPWEALSMATRLAAGRVAWVEERAREAEEAGDDKELARLLGESRRERALLARTAKAAIDAGVSERVARSLEVEARIVADAVGRALDALDASEEQRRLAFATAQRALLEPSGVVEGETG